MKTEFANSAFKSLSSLEKELTAKLRADASAANWPKPIVSTLSVKVNKNDISVSYPENLVDIIEDLEYGDGSRSPNPVFRKFFDKHQLLAQNAIAEWSIDYLFESEVLP